MKFSLVFFFVYLACFSCYSLQKEDDNGIDHNDINRRLALVRELLGLNERNYLTRVSFCRIFCFAFLSFLPLAVNPQLQLLTFCFQSCPWHSTISAQTSIVIYSYFQNGSPAEVHSPFFSNQIQKRMWKRKSRYVSNYADAVFRGLG